MRRRFTGFRAWCTQQLGAAVMLVIVAFLLVSFGSQSPRGHSQWQAWVMQPSVSMALFVFFAALLAHMWVGLRDVLLDYGRPVALRRFLLVAVAAGLAGLGLWLLRILLAPHT